MLLSWDEKILHHGCYCRWSSVWAGRRAGPTLTTSPTSSSPSTRSISTTSADTWTRWWPWTGFRQSSAPGNRRNILQGTDKIFFVLAGNNLIILEWFWKNVPIRENYKKLWENFHYWVEVKFYSPKVLFFINLKLGMIGSEYAAQLVQLGLWSDPWRPCW